MALKIVKGGKDVEKLPKTAEVFKFFNPADADVYKTTTLNFLKTISKAVKRGQVVGLGVVTVSGDDNLIAAYWTHAGCGAYPILAGCDLLKQRVWGVIHASAGEGGNV